MWESNHSLDAFFKLFMLGLINGTILGMVFCLLHNCYSRDLASLSKNVNDNTVKTNSSFVVAEI